MPDRESKLARRAGQTLSGLVVLMMLLDAASKWTMAPQVVSAMNGIGFPVHLTRPLAAVVLVCTVLYAVPRTAVLGAILLAGFLGGATAAKARLEDPTMLLPVGIGILAWAGLLLRDVRLRALLPFRR